MSKIEKLAIIVAFLTALLAAGSVCAQQEFPPTFEFSVSNSGARSMGFGGAFAALADDFSELVDTLSFSLIFSV